MKRFEFDSIEEMLNFITGYFETWTGNKKSFHPKVKYFSANFKKPEWALPIKEGWHYVDEKDSEHFYHMYIIDKETIIKNKELIFENVKFSLKEQIC